MSLAVTVSLHDECLTLSRDLAPPGAQEKLPPELVEQSEGDEMTHQLKWRIKS